MTLPRPGMMARVRNRLAIVSSVQEFGGGAEGLLHLAGLDYCDGDSPRQETVLWQREIGHHLFEPGRLPDVGAGDAMPARQFDALVRSVRWQALFPYVDPDGDAGPLPRQPLVAPLHAAVQAEDYQMVPLLKATRMPRVSMLLADDVGLGKTVEAGLILKELILRRRIQRVLILCPASLRLQWQEEMREKFGLRFDIVDRDASQQLRRALGPDANPWRSSGHLIASYHYLKQPDVLEEFRAASSMQEGAPQLPWDLLIVDEAHHLAPPPYGEESDLCAMLRRIAPQFEHKLFLTATPHNGRTRSFTGLLELLDPVRFSSTAELTDAERARLPEVVVRRLKREINAVTDPPRFADRHVAAVSVAFGGGERSLAAAFARFREALDRHLADASRSEQSAAAFAVEVLGKRLLSSSFTFARTWWRMMAGLNGEDTSTAQAVQATERSATAETADDREAEGRLVHAAGVIGSWLRPHASAPSMIAPIGEVSSALELIGLGAEAAGGEAIATPSEDARYVALLATIGARLRDPAGGWRSDERLIVFTEFKATLDYLAARLVTDAPGDGVVLQLFGGMGDPEREAIKAAFNDPRAAVRILLATDAASEGLNLQATARHVLHYDIPWNPARLEQRNGRLDRHGQARDVTCFHFTSEDDADVQFMAFVAAKVDRMREDLLGLVSDVFAASIHERLIGRRTTAEVTTTLAGLEERARGRLIADWDRSARSRDIDGEEESVRLARLKAELDLDADTLRDTFESALGLQVGLPRLEAGHRTGAHRILPPLPALWRETLDESLRLPGSRVLPEVTFEAGSLVEDVGGRPLFRPRADTALLHLSHDTYRHALALFGRTRFPGSGFEVSRWIARVDPGLPPDLDACIVLTLEEMAVNELHETFHHWVRTVALPVRAGQLLPPLPHRPARDLRTRTAAEATAEQRLRARRLWTGLEQDLSEWVVAKGRELTTRLNAQLGEDRERAMQDETARFRRRDGELSQLITETRMDRLERELVELEQERAQGWLFDSQQMLSRLMASREAKEAELQRLRTHIEDLRAELNRERERVLQRLVPRRHTLRGDAQLFPVAVEIRLPGGTP